MKESYLFKNTDYLKLTGNTDANSSLSLIDFLRLFGILFLNMSETKTVHFSKNLFFTIFFLLISFANYSQTVINQEKFEINNGIWDGAPNGQIYRTSTAPYEGTNALGFKGDGTLTSNAISTTAYNKIDVKFFVIGQGLTTGITMNLEYRSSSSASWTIVRTYTADANKDIRTNGNYYAFYATLFSTDYIFTTNSQFRFEAKGSNGPNYLVIDNISIIGTTYNSIIKGPGGITAGLETWLKADKVNGSGIGTDGSVVNSWQDVGKGNDANVIDAESTSLTNKPIFKNNSISNINFNPVVSFNNNPSASTSDFTGLTNKSELNATGGFYTNEQYIVVINDNPTTLNSVTPGVELFCAQTTSDPYTPDITGFGFGNSTIRSDNEVISYCLGNTDAAGTTIAENLRGYGINQNGTSISYSNSIGILSSRNKSTLNGQELYYNSNRIDNQEVGVPKFSNFANKRFWLGRSQTRNGSFGGRIAEVITYSNRKDDTSERRKIESYLSIKYGITMGISVVGGTMDYQNSNGNVIWNITDNAGYNFNIAGIGRDDSSELNQKQSRSSNLSSDVAIGLGSLEATNTANKSSFNSDLDYLIWGSNGLGYTSSGGLSSKSLNSTTTTTFTPIVRKWKIKESKGDVGEVIISIPATALTTSFSKTASEEYVLVVSSTEGFEDANIIDVVPLKTVESDLQYLQTWYDFDGTKFFTFAKASLQDSKLQLNIAAGDFLVGEKDTNLSSTFTISSWIRNSNNAVVRTFIAKGTEYDLKLNAAHKVEFSWNNAVQITSTTGLSDGKWHQVAVTYSGNTATLYIDGVLDKTVSSLPVPVTPNPTTAARFSIGGVFNSKSSITAPFLGDIDEVRIWDVALSVVQLRYIMNQEMVKFTDNTVNGKLIPQEILKNDIKTIPWPNVKAYYDLNSYYGTVADDKSISRNFMRIKYLSPSKQIVNTQTAPMPYISKADTPWSLDTTWENGTNQDLPNSASIVNSSTFIDWNIVKTNNNVTSNGNKTILGLIVNSGTLSATNDTQIEVSHYLKLDGKIDLVGMSQLLQTEGSYLNLGTAGSLERDQQGQANTFNYNYWGSPVWTINNGIDNTFSVGGVLKDGTNPLIPGAINWVGGYNGALSPFSLARYWIYKFDNKANAYANWTQIGETGSLEAGKGFTLKGAGTLGTQNLTFVGKPNNGTITNAVGADQLLLVGNPYPSALDANLFIDDNIGSISTAVTDPVIDGALYFWEHYSTNSTHNLGGYQGGYGIYNKSGGVLPSSIGVDFISGLGTTSKMKVPQRYIPVGQGFFVIGKTGSGGDVKFKNSQRAFFKEDNPASQTTYRIPVSPKGSDQWTDNSDDQIAKDTYKKILLGYNSYNETFHRQVLLAFMDEKANSEMNAGYDAYNIDDSPSDMYLLNGENELAIQGEGYFDETSSYPIGVRSDSIGKISFVLDGLENFDKNQSIFIYDKSDDTYHNINGALYEVELPAGTIEDRFYLRFTDKTLATNTFNLSNSDEVIVIVNQDVTVQSSNHQIKNIAVYDLLGRKIDNYKKVNALKFTLSHLNRTTAGLIVKITLDNDTVVSKKIIY